MRSCRRSGGARRKAARITAAVATVTLCGIAALNAGYRTTQPGALLSSGWKLLSSWRPAAGSSSGGAQDGAAVVAFAERGEPGEQAKKVWKHAPKLSRAALPDERKMWERKGSGDDGDDARVSGSWKDSSSSGSGSGSSGESVMETVVNYDDDATGKTGSKEDNDDATGKTGSKKNNDDATGETASDGSALKHNASDSSAMKRNTSDGSAVKVKMKKSKRHFIADDDAYDDDEVTIPLHNHTNFPTNASRWTSGNSTVWKDDDQYFYHEALDHLDFIQWTEGYDVTGNFSYYPWERIVEPFRRTIMEVQNAYKTVEYTWTIEYKDAANLATVAFVMNQVGPRIEVNFTHPAQQYTVHILGTHKYGPNANSTAQWIKAPVMCKYVRRELRKLTTADRENFLSALQVVHRVNLTMGQTFYGDKFMDAVTLTRKHLAKMTLDECTPYHNGNVFFPAHAAFSLEVEQSLQSIDHRIALPYWDYTIDAVMYGPHWAHESPVFADDWFGAANVGGVIDDYWGSKNVITTGRWAYTPIITDHLAPEHNGYGRVTDEMNQDPVEYVTRGAKSVCGLATEITLPGCTEMKRALQADDLTQLDHLVEYEFHGYLHLLLGGSWDCGASLEFSALEAEVDADLGRRIEETALNLNTLWRYMFFSGYLKFPDDCFADTTFKDCQAVCPGFQDRIDNSTTFRGSDVYEVMYTAGILDALDGILTFYNESSGMYKVSGLDDRQSTELYRWLLKVLCSPGKMAPMATPLAATSDPIFWSSHNLYERIWAWMRLRGRDGSGAFDDEWAVQADACAGQDYHDTLPFRNFAHESTAQRTRKDGQKDYTNQELVELFNPTNPRLPYVFDAIGEYNHCEW